MVDGFTNDGNGGVTLMVVRSRSGANVEPVSACWGTSAASFLAGLGDVSQFETGALSGGSCEGCWSELRECPRRNGKQFEQRLLAFSQEQFLQLPLALHRQRMGGMLRESSQLANSLHFPSNPPSGLRVERGGKTWAKYARADTVPTHYAYESPAGRPV